MEVGFYRFLTLASEVMPKTDEGDLLDLESPIPQTLVKGPFMVAILGITDHGLKHTDDTYALRRDARRHTGSDRVINWLNFGWTNGMTWRCHQLTVPGVTFDGALPPKWKSTQPYIEGIGCGTTAVSGRNSDLLFECDNQPRSGQC